MKKLLAGFENDGLSREQIWDKCEEFMAAKPEIQTEEEELLYNKLRAFFVAADAEKCENSRDESKLHSKYLAKIDEIRENEAKKARALRQKQWEEARRKEVERKKAEVKRLQDSRMARAKGIERKIQNKRHQQMRDIRKEFFDVFYDFSTTIERKHASVKKLFADAAKLYRNPTSEEEPDFEEAKKILGRVTILRPDTIKLLTEIRTLYNAQGTAYRIETALRKGNPKFAGLSVIIKNLSCKVEKIENFTIYGKVPGLSRVYTITLEEMCNTKPAQFRRFMQEAFGPYGLNLAAYLPVFYALNGDVKTASLLGEGPSANIMAKRNLANFYKPYFDYVLKENRSNAALKKKLTGSVGKTRSYHEYLYPPRPKAAPPKKAAPAKKAPPKKAAPAKKAPPKKAPPAKKK